MREYIASGEPVASSAARPAAGLGVSSATVRNILARLEERATSSSRTPRPAAFRPTAAIASTSTCCSSRSARAGRRTPSRPAAARRRRAAARFDAVAASRTWSRRRRATSASRCGRRTKAPCSSASSSSRSAATRVLVVIVARGGHVIQKVIDIGEPLGADELRAGGELPERRVLGAAARTARARPCSSGCNEERLLYDALLARAMRLAIVDVRRSARPTARSTSTAPRRCSSETQRPDARHAADAAADDRGEAAAGPPAERIHRRPRPDRRHRRRASRPEPAVRSAWSRRPTTTATASARSASSARRACAIRAPSPSSTAPRRPSRACCAIPTSARRPWLTNTSPTNRRTTRPATADRIAPDAGRRRAADPLADLQRERDDYYDRLLRKTAEFDNYRKRDRARAPRAGRPGGRRPPAGAAARRRRLRSRADGRGRRGARRLSEGRRADPREAARSAAQARREADRGARRRLRSEPAPGGRCTRRAPSTAKAK